MKTYKIIGKTDRWIASRDRRFNGKCEITIEEGLTLRDAQKRLLDMFNKDYEKGYTNWGLLASNNPSHAASFKDGTRCYDYDSRTYSIELDKLLIDTKKGQFEIEDTEFIRIATSTSDSNFYYVFDISTSEDDIIGHINHEYEFDKETY